MIMRRTLLAAAAASAATSAFGQSQSGRTVGGSNAGSPEAQYIQQTMMVGSLSLATSQVAEQKARIPRLKEFSQFEVAEQQTIADVLRSLQNPGQVGGTVKPPSEAEVEQHLDEHGRQMLQQLRSMQAGRDFDRQYHAAQTDGHQQLLRIQQDYLKSAKDVGSINVAKLASGMIKEHLQLLTDIQEEISSGRG